MKIETDFEGGNIRVLSVEGDVVTVEPEIRGGAAYFYWAFRVRGAEGRALRFVFPQKTRVGPFGAAVGYDLIHWFWSNTKTETETTEGFTYSFSENEHCVYFAHDMVYTPERLKVFLQTNHIIMEEFCKTAKGRSVPCFWIGSGNRNVLLTSRHHACESTGTHVLEGFASACLKRPIPNVRFLFVPMVDFDGVCEGDAGKNRLPHDHNRDYAENSPSIYPEIRAIRAFAEENRLITNMDFHSPHHSGWINDYPYFMRCTYDDGGIYGAFTENLRGRTAADGVSMIYTGEQDIRYGDKWNEKDKPDMRNWILGKTEWNYSFLMEIPYFGLENNRFDQASAVALGKCVYEAFREIAEDPRLTGTREDG